MQRASVCVLISPQTISAGCNSSIVTLQVADSNRKHDWPMCPSNYLTLTLILRDSPPFATVRVGSVHSTRQTAS